MWTRFETSAWPLCTAANEINLKDERDAVGQYNRAVKVSVEAGDEGSRVLFEQMIKDEERHVDYLEAQIHSIEEVGSANY